ncbi:hypothetical protein B0H10DRAFT_2101262 [Mycena sp. CBHHK59/15]|nr:hypothetical protein B0H10DRAFT_2101262 [Mycena sp. CBHHK59/15]
MDSDVEMIEPPAPPEQVPASPVPSAASSAHVSRASRSRSRSVLDDLDDYGSPKAGDEEAADDNTAAAAAEEDAPPATNEVVDPDAPMEDPESPLERDLDAEEHDVDASDSENSSDDASEDDVDKDLIPDADVTDAESGEGKGLSPAHWDDNKAQGAGDMTIAALNGGADQNGAIRLPVLVDASARSNSPTAAAAPPTSSLTVPTTSTPKTKKPKSHRASPPLPPPAPPPPMQTIRLVFELGGPDNYEVDVKRMAREEGFAWGTPVSKKYRDEGSSGSDGEDGSDGEEGDVEKGKDVKDKDAKDADGDVEMDADGKPKLKKPKKKSKKSKAAAEYYDVSDPFIDDSELAIDERTYFAQTKQKGFYVSSGEVALVRDKSPKKPKSKKKLGPTLSLNVPTASTSALKPPAVTKKAKAASAAAKVVAPASKAKPPSKALGTKDSPIPLLEEDEEESKSDVFGTKPRSSTGKAKAKPDDDGDEANAIAEGVNRMKGKWKERVSISGPGSATLTNGASHGEQQNRQNGERSASAGGGTRASRMGTMRWGRRGSECFHPDLQLSIEKMKQAIAAESWETKSKFPPSLKPLLAALSLQAITLDEYDDQFFNLMPMIFPYNKFTMSKLIKRTIFHDHTELLNQRQDALLEQLRVLATEGFPKAQEEWERSLQNYEEKRKEKDKARAEGDPDSVEGSTGPTRHPTEDPEARVGSAGLSSAGDGDKNKGDDKEGPGKGGAHHGPPLKKYRMTETMKNIVWQLVLLSNECCRLENEKNSLEGSVLQVSEQGLRKVLYQRIVAAFPDGWMSSGQISRDVSAMKKKFEKEAQDD